MATTIQTKSGAMWHTDYSIQQVRGAIRDDEEIPIWWYASWGQRYRESVFIAEDEIAFIRTESDDG